MFCIPRPVGYRDRWDSLARQVAVDHRSAALSQNQEYTSNVDRTAADSTGRVAAAAAYSAAAAAGVPTSVTVTPRQ